MRVNQVLDIIDQWSPLSYSEDFDNTGLLIGDPQATVSNILVCLDCLESVIDEAIEKDCNLIVSFHPIVFSGLKKITGKTYVERVVTKAIKNNIAIIAIHTALDNSWNGVNSAFLNAIGATQEAILIPKQGAIKRLSTFVPKAEADALLDALFEAGAGAMGDYSECSFSVTGTGSFKPNISANPSVGELGKRHLETEAKIQVIFESAKQAAVLKALFTTHSYQEVAYELTTLEIPHKHIGMGMIGNLEIPMSEADFLKHLKTNMNANGIRHSALTGKTIKRIAVLGGSGAFAIAAAKAAQVDAFVSADFKYHDFYKAEGALLLADIGHYESEQYTKNLIVSHLSKKITNFAVILSEINTNPIIYF